MSVQRIRDAPRLIEWTGERCVPWAPDPPLIYEHFHRYLFAARLVGGRDVLELASGEGFGAALLAESARSVIGVDVDEQTVEHSTLNYSGDNLEFKVADARELTEFAPQQFGAVVAFELIEHLAEHDQMLEAIKRVLAPDGILIISTPDRQAYSDAREYENPYHVRELTSEEAHDLLRSHFGHVTTWAQRTIGGSLLSPLEGPAPESDALQRFIIERSDGDWRLVDGAPPMYVIGVASNAELPAMPRQSLLVDAGDDLLKVGEQARASEHAAREELEVAARDLTTATTNQEQMLAEISHWRTVHERLSGEHEALQKEAGALREDVNWLRAENERVSAQLRALLDRRSVKAALRVADTLNRTTPGR